MLVGQVLTGGPWELATHDKCVSVRGVLKFHLCPGPVVGCMGGGVRLWFWV